MSAILMCDNCGKIFSVNERLWTAVTVETRDPRDNNSYNHGAQTRHFGPCCNLSMSTPVRPRLALTEAEETELIREETTRVNGT